MVNYLKIISFELLVLYWFLRCFELLDFIFIRCDIKHTIVAVFTIAVIIMPLSYIFILMLVALPIWLLYEISIYVVKDKSYHLNEYIVT